MRTLIIPDLHLRWKKAEDIIVQASSQDSKYIDSTVFLGDYFDDFSDSVLDNVEMAKWLKWSIQQSNRIHLMGNHDMSYRFPHKSYKCSGYTYEKEYSINQILTQMDWNKLELYTWVGDYLCSHAGLHQFFYDKYGKGKEFKPWLKSICNEAIDNALDGYADLPILRAGMSRGGIETYGGIVWCDSSEFIPISGINQIFGHTSLPQPKWINFSDPNAIYSKNLALDVNNADYYAIYDDSNVDNPITIHKTRGRQ